MSSVIKPTSFTELVGPYIEHFLFGRLTGQIYLDCEGSTKMNSITVVDSMGAGQANAPAEMSADCAAEVEAYIRVDDHVNTPPGVHVDHTVVAHYKHTTDGEAVSRASAVIFCDDLPTKVDVYDNTLRARTEDWLEAKFNAVHPPTHPALVNRTTTPHDVYQRRCEHVPGAVLIVADEWYEGNDLSVLLELATQFGKVNIYNSSTLWHADGELGNRGCFGDMVGRNPRLELAKAGCVYVDTGSRGGMDYVEHDPKAAKRVLKGLATRKKNALAREKSGIPVNRSRTIVTVYAIHNLTVAIHTEIMKFTGPVPYDERSREKSCALSSLRQQLLLLTAMYGPAAALRMPAYHAFLKLWKAGGEVFLEKLDKHLKEYYKALLARFDKDCKRRRLPDLLEEGQKMDPIQPKTAFKGLV